MAVYHLKTPLAEQDVRQLKIGDTVYLSGRVFTGRSRIHRYIFDEGNSLPFSVESANAMIHVGPIVTRRGGKWNLVSFMPTSSLRFEKWGAASVEAWKLRMIVGKTTMGKKTMEMMRSFGCVHVSPQSVSPNLWLNSIEILGVELFEELGSIEASWQLKLDELGPFIVDIDAMGNNLFETMDESIGKARDAALEKMGLPEDFSPTRLY
ncbi:MAG: fumarate hydratase C-terminal domain-containing protein [Clostridia bacterium]|nr:fumarate hydratase C-terminal domain-containing protein [Clostridia bacterium]